MSERIEVGARTRLPDAGKTEGKSKSKQKLKFEKEELEGVGEEASAGSLALGTAPTLASVKSKTASKRDKKK